MGNKLIFFIIGYHFVKLNFNPLAKLLNKRIHLCLSIYPGKMEDSKCSQGCSASLKVPSVQM